MVNFVRWVMENIVVVGFLGFLLITVPAIGIMVVHESKGK